MHKNIKLYGEVIIKVYIYYSILHSIFIFLLKRKINEQMHAKVPCVIMNINAFKFNSYNLSASIFIRKSLNYFVNKMMKSVSSIYKTL